VTAREAFEGIEQDSRPRPTLGHITSMRYQGAQMNLDICGQNGSIEGILNVTSGY
jgi:hypothetical protein